jgi:hypothetical protein
MTDMETQVQRQRRVSVEIQVTITTVLDTADVGLTDLTEHGAQIVGCGLIPGTRFQIEYMGQTIFAQCRWTEVDRMGVKFAFALSEGPLFERLMLARAAQFPDEIATAPQIAYTPAPVRPTARTFGRATGGFGRRTV